METTAEQPESTKASAASSNPSCPSFDIESYISRYSPKSNISLQRLLFTTYKLSQSQSQTITNKNTNGDSTSKMSMSTLGYQLLEQRLKSNGNTKMYREVFGPSSNTNTNATTNTNANTNTNVNTDGHDSAGDNMELDDFGGGGAGGAAVIALVENEITESENYPKPFGINCDMQYIQATETNTSNQLQTLEANISNAQSHLSKDSIRTSYQALAKFCHSRGMSEDAVRFYTRAKEHSMNSSGGSTSHTFDIILSLAECGLEAQAQYVNHVNYHKNRNYSNVNVNANVNANANVNSIINQNHDYDKMVIKLYDRNDSNNVTDEIYNSKLKCARGIAYMNQGEYYHAATTFLSIKNVDFTNQFNSVLSAEDIALYGGILGLITLDRSKIESMIEIEAWRERLELVPSLQEAIRCYMKAEYGECLQLIKSLKEDLMMMDIFLNPHVETLWKMMREKCIVQYFQPYLSVSLITMKESFGFDDVDEVEDVIASLIESKRIVGARIDGVNRTLTSMSVKGLERRKRKMMMSKIGMMGDKLIGEVEGMILRMSCLENNIIVTDDSKSNNRRGRGHGRGGPMSNVPYDRVVYSSDDEYFDML